MNNINNRLNSTLIDNCLQILPDEYFIMSLSVIAVFSFLFILLFLMTAVLAHRTKKSIVRKGPEYKVLLES